MTNSGFRADACARRKASFVAALVAFGLTSSCSQQSGNNYGGAAIGAAVAVATVATMRAVTGECWARCDQGQVCDRESGLCVRGECYPTCGWGQHCERLSTGLMCVPDPNAGLVTVSAPAPPPPAPAPSTIPPEPAAKKAPEPSAAPTTTLDPSWTEDAPPEAEPAAPPESEQAPASEPPPAPVPWFTPKD